MTSKPENQTLANLFQFMTFDEIAEMYNVSKDTVIKWKTTMTKDINFDFFKILKEKITSIQSDYENIMTNTRLSLIRDLNISPISIFFFDKEKTGSNYITIGMIYCFDKNARDYLDSFVNFKDDYILIGSLKEHENLKSKIIDRHDIIITDFTYGSIYDSFFMTEFIADELVKETENLNLYD